MEDVSLQVNLSPGDLAYARLTVPRLVDAHPRLGERLLVVDCCRPQRTRIVAPDTRFPEAIFRERLAAVRALAREWLAGGLFDRVEILEPQSPWFPILADTYCRPWMVETHDYAGCAFMAYWAAFKLARGRFLLHYDADMLLHQAPGFDWVAEGRRHLLSNQGMIAASPRTSPPGFESPSQPDGPTRFEGRPFTSVDGGWINDWFSTRCFLFDLQKLHAQSPLISTTDSIRLRLRKFLRRGYPPAPEIVLHRGLGARGFRRITLSSQEAWLLHPTSKPAAYLDRLPSILAAVSAGRAPASQRGQSEIDLPAWELMLDGATRPA